MFVKTVLVICGSGIATSTVVAMKVKELCAARNIRVTVRQGRAVEASAVADEYDLVLTTTPSLKVDTKTPVINAVPLLNGIGEEKVKEQIVSALIQAL